MGRHRSDMAPNMKSKDSIVTSRPVTKQWEVEVISCFRTGGSMPIPKPVIVLPSYTEHRKELVYLQATEESLTELLQEPCPSLGCSPPCLERVKVTVPGEE